MAVLSVTVSEKAEAFAAVEASKRGLPGPAAYAANLLEETANKNGAPAPSTAFHNITTDLDSLIRGQGVRPITDFQNLVADFWPADESADDFVAAVREWRQGRPSTDTNP